MFITEYRIIHKDAEISSMQMQSRQCNHICIGAPPSWVFANVQNVTMAHFVYINCEPSESADVLKEKTPADSSMLFYFCEEDINDLEDLDLIKI